MTAVATIPYYNTIRNTRGSKVFLDLFYNLASKNAQTKISNVNELVKLNSLNLGFIFMEMRDGYDSVSNWDEGKVNPNRMFDTKTFLAMTGEVLNRLHKVCRVTHGDLHKSNLLVNPIDESYYSPIRGNILIIDWGRAKIHQNVYSAYPNINNSPQVQYEALIEKLATGATWHWAYQWLDLPGRGIGGKDYGSQWNYEGINELYQEFQRFRPQNRPPENILPNEFYQPGPGNLRCQWKRVCDKNV